MNRSDFPKHIGMAWCRVKIRAIILIGYLLGNDKVFLGLGQSCELAM